MSEILCVILTI